MLPDFVRHIAGRLFLTGALALAATPLCSAAKAPTDDPVLASFGDYVITLRLVEEFARELPSPQRVPLARDTAKWRQTICRELAKNVIFTRKAVAEQRHADPRYLRAREYFTQEYLSYALIRDEVLNRIDVSREALEALYHKRKQDYFSSPTVTLRLIRVRTEEEATSAARRVAAGESFESVEREMSGVSPRYKNRVLGPFPNPEDRTAIPPPDTVVEAALATAIGATTGPIEANGFWFLVRTEGKTPGRQLSYDDVAEQVEKRMRQGMGDHLGRAFLAQLKKELGVVVNEAAVADQQTRPDDVVATIGRVRMPFAEFSDLNGRVRGPALTLAQLEEGRLAQFVTPWILAEAGRIRGYLERAEYQRAAYYYDLQQLGGRMADFLAGQKLRVPSDAELRQRYRQELAHRRDARGPRPTFEQMKDELCLLIQQHERPAVEERLISEALAADGFRYEPDPACTRLTALEALTVASKKLPADARLIEMAGIRSNDPAAEPAGRREPPVVPMPLTMSGAGRAEVWRISYSTKDGTSADLLVQGGGSLHNGSPEFTSNPLCASWSELLRFDTDGLARIAMDNGICDFAARYNDRIRIVTSVQFGYADGRPADCVIRFAVTPADPSIDDGIELRYDGRSGDQTKRRVGEAPVPCDICPGPDKPIL